MEVMGVSTRKSLDFNLRKIVMFGSIVEIAIVSATFV